MPNIQAFHSNLDFAASRTDQFLVSGDGATAKLWQLEEKKPVKGIYKGETPKPWTTPYWFIECEKEVIRNHGDIWSAKAMDIYAGLYRIAESRRRD